MQLARVAGIAPVFHALHPRLGLDDHAFEIFQVGDEVVAFYVCCLRCLLLLIYLLRFVVVFDLCQNCLLCCVVFLLMF